MPKKDKDTSGSKKDGSSTAKPKAKSKPASGAIGKKKEAKLSQSEAFSLAGRIMDMVEGATPKGKAEKKHDKAKPKTKKSKGSVTVKPGVKPSNAISSELTVQIGSTARN